MHKLDQLLAEWRRNMKTAPRLGRETLDELENHLRENVDHFVRSGMTEAEAFRRAVTELGTAPRIASEFQKLDESTWLPVKVIIGIGVTEALALTFLLIARMDAGRLTFLLATHVFMITLGYTTTFLVGALGICFVGQRCFSDFTPLRERSLTRVTFILGCVAAGLSAVGVILGMVWAKAEWGRYWAWDAKEIGGLSVVVWQAFFLSFHRFAGGSARGVFGLSVLGNIVVSLSWFGANNYGTGNHSLLLATVAFNVVFFLLGFAPAGWLRPRKMPPPQTLNDE